MNRPISRRLVLLPLPTRHTPDETLTKSLFDDLGATPFQAVREAFRGGYRKSDAIADILAGIVVGVVALPLSMALAIATGVPPQYGLYTAIVAGFVIALTGGSPVQVSGPTAAFIVILAPITATMGLGGLLVATVMAGVLLVAMGLARFGRLIQFIPYPVTTGFTAGIAVVIASLQVKDFLGLTFVGKPEHFAERIGEIAHSLVTVRWSDTLVGAVTLALLLLWPKVTKKIPAPLIAMLTGGVVACFLGRLVPDATVATIGSRFSWTVGNLSGSGVPPIPPTFVLPWDMLGPDGAPLGMSQELLRSLLGPAFAIAVLGAIESLLSAVVADGMSGRKHDPNAELLGQGIGNIIAPFFGGFAATGAIARTATNIRNGARTPVAAMVHSLFVLLAMLVLAPLLGYLPMASLSAMLLVVAWNMSETKHFIHVLRVAPKSDITVLLTCFGLTVFMDMVISVATGVLLAALLFMRRMAEVSGVRLVGESLNTADTARIPKDTMVYEIAGPLFFGAAQKAMSQLGTVSDSIRHVILDLQHVPAMDATGLVNLESALERLFKRRIDVTLCGVQPQPFRLLQKAHIIEPDGHGQVRVAHDVEEAVGMLERVAL